MTVKTIGDAAVQSSHPPDEDKGHRPFLFVVLCLTTFGLWLPAMSSSLTFDEAGTFWIVRKGLSGLSLSYKYGGVGPFYYFIEWLAKSILGTSEVALRVPSLIAGLISTYLIYRIAKRLFDSETGLLASLIFVSTSSIVFAINDARPYAIALMFLLASTLVLIRLSDHFRWTEAFIYALTVAAMLYLSYVFATALLAHAVFVIVRRRSGGRITAGKALALLATIVVAMTPAIPHIAEIIARRDLLSVPGDSSSTALLTTVLSPAVAVALILSALLSLRRGPLTFDPPEMTRSTGALLLSWWLAPPILLYIATRALSVNLFWPRYLLPFAAGFALLVGWLIRSVKRSNTRRLLIITLVVTSVWAYGSQHWIRWHSDEQVRLMTQVIRANVTESATPVLLPGFIETSHLEWVTDPEKVSAQLAPISYYPIHGHPILIPYRVTTQTENYLEGVTERSLLPASRFILVERSENGPVKSWLDARLRAAGYRSNLFNGSGSIWVYEYARSH